MGKIEENRQKLLAGIANGTLVPVIPSQDKLPPGLPNAGDARLLRTVPYLRAPLPSTFQMGPDTMQAFQKNTLPGMRIAPLPPALTSAVGAVAVSQNTLIVENAPPPVAIPAFYDIIFSLSGRPIAMYTYSWLTFDRAVSFVANFGASAGSVLVNPTSSAAFSIKKNGVGIGSITVSTSGIVTFASTGGLPQTAASGDDFTLVSPASDPTLSGIMFTLSGKPA